MHCHFRYEVLNFDLPVHSIHLHPSRPFDLGPFLGRSRPLHRTFHSVAASAATCTGFLFRRIAGTILPLPLSLD